MIYLHGVFLNLPSLENSVKHTAHIPSLLINLIDYVLHLFFNLIKLLDRHVKIKILFG